MLPDVLCEKLKIVFCGTAVGSRSAEVQSYYAYPTNKFWRVLHISGLTNRLLSTSEFRLLPTFGLGLTDFVRTSAGVDSTLTHDDFDIWSFEEKILRYAPQMVCFNGKGAAKAFLGSSPVEYGEIKKQIGSTRLFVAPSTSGSASGYWDEEIWHDLSNRILRVHID